MGFIVGLLSSVACWMSLLLTCGTHPDNSSRGGISQAIRITNSVMVMVREHSLEVVRGDSVLLPCSYVTMSPLSRLSVVWTVAPLSNPGSPSQVIVYDHGQVIEDPALYGRVGFVAIPWKADIFLNDTRLSDAGTYRCVVNNPPEPGDPGIGELSLSVLTPPSLPLCLWDGDPEVGGSVTLSCAVEEAVPIPEVRWDKLEPEQVSLPVNMEGHLKGTISIDNVSSQNSGLYRCSVSNPLGTQNCYISLNVYSAPAAPTGIVQGVLLSLSMAVVLVSLLALMLWLHRAGAEVGRGEDEDGYNVIRYTPTLLRRSFV